MKLRLTDADRARYGGDEWLDWDSSRLTVSEAEELETLLGIDVATYGNSWLRSGKPVAVRWALWLSLRRSGVDVAWDDFDPDLLGARAQSDPPVGKDTPSTPPVPSGSSGSDSPPP